jgi:hypothetical protein
MRGGVNHCCTVIGLDSIMSNQPRMQVYLQLRKSDVENKDLFLYSHPVQHLASVKIPIKSALHVGREFLHNEHLL